VERLFKRLPRVCHRRSKSTAPALEVDEREVHRAHPEVSKIGGDVGLCLLVGSAGDFRLQEQCRPRLSSSFDSLADLALDVVPFGRSTGDRVCTRTYSLAGGPHGTTHGMFVRFRAVHVSCSKFAHEVTWVQHDAKQHEKGKQQTEDCGWHDFTRRVHWAKERNNSS
jgi:hypothetical protein